ncbi:MAG TPA: hypothetical protein VF432_20105 [Thermoanaerobaculia bacterium]
MRTFIIILCIVLAAVAAVAIYLVVTTPKDAAPLRAPLTASQQELVAHVPADAEAYALISAPAVLLGKLETNPVTRDAVEQWTAENALPPKAMLGGADAVVWKSGKATSYAVRFDAVRALIVRTWTMFSDVEAQWAGRTLIVGAQSSAAPGPPAELAMAAGLPPADVLVVQRKESRGAFPPIPRPAITAVKVEGGQIDITSRAPGGGDAAPPAGGPAGAPHSLSATAMMAVAFTDPPRVMGDLDRLIAADIDHLIGDGASVAVYRVDTGTLLPRPFMAVVVPADEKHRATLAEYRSAIEMVGQTAEANGELVVAFDRSSATQYLKDEKRPMPWPANRWSMRLDPQRLIPVLRKVGDNPALRFATPRIHRGARDLRRWMGALEQARSIEAAASAGGGFEELRVRVASK